MTFVYDNFRYADNCFYNNGYNRKTSLELHEINKREVDRYIKDNYMETLLYHIPEAKEYINELKK